MATDLYRDKLFNDGEGLTHGDLNDTRAWMVARIADQLFEHGTGILAADKDPDLWGENGADTTLSSLIYTLTGGDGVLKQGTAATKVSTLGGTIFQKVANADGAAATFLPYTLAVGEFDLTIGAGDATNPRIDIVQVKLELVDGGSESRDFKDAVTGALSSSSVNKTRRVQATVSLKAGTPGATPSYPAPDAGYAVLGAVRVPATWTTGIVADGTGSSSAGLRQCSVPLRIEAFTTHASQMSSTDVNWSYNAQTGSFVAGAAATSLFAFCPAGAHGKRIVGVAVIAKWSTSGTVKLRQAPRTAIGPSNVTNPANDLSGSLVNTDGNVRYFFAHLGKIADASSDSNPSAANGPIGDPFWACGGKGGPAHQPFSASGVGTISGGMRSALVFDAGNTSQIMEVIWFCAG